MTPARGGLRPDEIDELLRRPLLASLATIDPDGFPSIVPVWIEWDGATAWVVARATAAYVDNVRRDTRAGLSVVDVLDSDRRVQSRGHATIVDGPGPMSGRTLDLARSMAERYEGAPGLAYIEETRDWPRVLIAFVPDRIRSWGSPDWHPRYPASIVTPARESQPMPAFDVHALRAEFPSLALEQDGKSVAYFDGPGGTQVPQRVIDAVVDHYRTSNANDGGAFQTSERSDASTATAHAAVADFLGAASADEIKFGANTTSLTFHLSRSLGALFAPGDEIVVTTLDHESNVSPWRRLADDRGLVVKTVDIQPEDVTLDLEMLESALGPKTRLVAVGYASNAVGTINPVREIVARAHEIGAWAWIDAVHYAPHGPIDVRDLGADFLTTSAYKWFGPHVGVLYGRAEVLDRLPEYKVRPAHDRFETGTQNFEGIAGTLAAVDYLQSVGERFGARATGGDGLGGEVPADRRERLVAGMRAIQAWEASLADRLIRDLASIPGVRIHGIADPARIAERTPTLAVTIEGTTPRAAAEALGRQGMFAWDGDFYAQALIERLGLFETGGVLRLGLVHYNTPEEVDRLLDGVEGIAADAALGRVTSRVP